MLPLFLALLSFGSYCSSAPTGAAALIQEARSMVDRIKESEFQDLLTPTHKMEERCTLKKLNIFIESLNSLKTKRGIKPILRNLEYIQTWVETRIPELKEYQQDCDGGRESFENFKKKLSEFLRFLKTNYLS